MRTIFALLAALLIAIPAIARDDHRGRDRAQGRGRSTPGTTSPNAGETRSVGGDQNLVAGDGNVVDGVDNVIQGDDVDVPAASAFAPWSGKCASVGGAAQGEGFGASFGTGNVVCDHEIVQAAIANHIRSVHDVRSACEELTITKYGVGNVFEDSVSCRMMSSALQLQVAQIEKMVALVDDRTSKVGSWCDRWIGWLKPLRLVCGN